MAAAAFLTFAFLICKVNSQILGLGPYTFTLPKGCEPTAPCCTEGYRQSIPVCMDPCSSIKTTPNIINIPPQPCLNVPAPNILNLPAPSCVQNQVPINQPIMSAVLSTQPIPNNVLPKCTNAQCQVCTTTPQLAPSIITNAATPPVVTVVDNTLANSLANALQLLIISNLLDNSETSNFAQNLPCINNYEIVTPDFAVPAISCDYFSNMVYPESVVSIPEPVFACPEPTFSCQEPVFSCQEPVFTCQEQVFSFPDPVCSCPEKVVSCQEQVVFPTNFGTFSLVDNSGCQCGSNPMYLETPTQFVAQVAPACNQPMAPITSIPAVASIPQMALELPFPTEIPAQLTCNFGFLPSNEPCVTFNVEPLPCKNLVSGNFGNFF